jgi:hypothetical protein
LVKIVAVIQASLLNEGEAETTIVAKLLFFHVGAKTV